MVRALCVSICVLHMAHSSHLPFPPPHPQDLLALYTKAGVKGTPVVFLLTDNQIVKEKFLVYLNDLLSTGLVADLFAPEDRENFINAVGALFVCVAGRLAG